MRYQRLRPETIQHLRKLQVGERYNGFVRVSPSEVEQILSDRKPVAMLMDDHALWVNCVLNQTNLFFKTEQ